MNGKQNIQIRMQAMIMLRQIHLTPDNTGAELYSISPQLKEQKMKENKPDSRETNISKSILMKLEFLFEPALFAP